MKFEVAGEDQRRDYCYEHSADGAADCDDQVKGREVAIVRLQPGQLAVTNHADAEEQRRVSADLNRDAGAGAAQHGERNEHRGAQRGMKYSAAVPSRIVEAYDERQQVDRKLG